MMSTTHSWVIGSRITQVGFYETNGSVVSSHSKDTSKEWGFCRHQRILKRNVSSTGFHYLKLKCFSLYHPGLSFYYYSL